LKPAAVVDVFVAGKKCTTNTQSYDRWAVTDLSSLKWTDIYTRAKVGFA
jgi:hypothetical protein